MSWIQYTVDSPLTVLILIAWINDDDDDLDNVWNGLNRPLANERGYCGVRRQSTFHHLDFYSWPGARPFFFLCFYSRNHCTCYVL